MDSRPRNLLLLLLLTSLLHFSQFARGEPSYIIDTVGLTVLPSNTVQSGTPVTLRCQVSVSHDNITNLNHTFQFTRDSIPILTSTTAEDSYVYKLDSARAFDSGLYECRVTVKDKSKVSNGEELSVTGLQTPILHLSNTRPFESEEFTATCSAPEEKGSLIFRFYQRLRTGQSLKIKELAPTGNSSETTLVLRQVGDSLLYCEYEINLVSSGTRRSNHSEEIQLLVQALHILPVMNVLPSTEVFEGDIVEIICRVVNPPKKLEVFLTRDRRILKKAPVSLVYRFRVQDGDSGEFVCKAEWGSVQKETYKSITVKELFSKPCLTVEPIDIFEGDHFELNCSVAVYFPERVKSDATQFVIFKDNSNITTSDTYHAVANADKNGNYTCKVHAGVHGIVKESKKVVIKAKVPVSKPMLSVVGGTLVLGKPFQLLCHSDGGTLPITYTLYGPAGQNENRIVSKPGKQAVFNVSAIFSISDLNKFLCHVKNKQNTPPKTESGQQLQRSTVIIEPVSKPVIRPSTMSVSEGQTMSFVCSVKQGTPPIQFSWFHEKKKSPLKSRNSNKLNESYSIIDVTKEDEGKYYCVCTNQANDNKQSDGVAIQVTLASWKKGLIAVFCILLTLTLILGCACKRRLRKCKRQRMTELSVKSVGTKVERLSLTQAEFDQAANVTPGMIGKSIWSEHVSGSESEDQNSVAAAETEYTEVQTRQADPNRAPVKKGTDTVYSEVRNSKQGVPEQADGQGSVEYAQLNHDTDQHGDGGNHSHQSVQDNHIVEIDNSVDVNTAPCGE